MGLTVEQSYKIIQMVEAKWNPLELARQRAVKAKYDDVLAKWESDPHVATFTATYKKAMGSDFLLPTTSYVYGTTGVGNTFLREVQSYWNEYLAGVKNGELWDALRDAGYYLGIEPSNVNFVQTTQAQILQVALRTTGKNWARLSDVFAEMVIGISLAKDTDELLKAVESFTNNLK
jgi:hypothetical protein